MKRRNTVSVTPAIGASTVAGATSTPPITTEAGTRTAAGMLFSRGLSQALFIDTFFMRRPHLTGCLCNKGLRDRRPSL
jgi:hypothetical protein